MVRRSKVEPPIKLTIWRRDGKLWYAKSSDLVEAIERSPNSQEIIRQRMGVGYHYIQDVLEGKGIDGWAVAHIEWGLRPDVQAPPTHSWPK